MDTGYTFPTLEGRDRVKSRRLQFRMRDRTNYLQSWRIVSSFVKFPGAKRRIGIVKIQSFAFRARTGTDVLRRCSTFDYISGFCIKYTYFIYTKLYNTYIVFIQNYIIPATLFGRWQTTTLTGRNWRENWIVGAILNIWYAK